MLFRGIVKKYTADLILPTKCIKIIDMKEKLVQNMEVAVSLDGIFTPNPRELWWIFLFDILHFTMDFREI